MPQDNSPDNSPDNSRAQNGLTYKDAGVDIDAGEALVERIGPAAKATRSSVIESRSRRPAESRGIHDVPRLRVHL